MTRAITERWVGCATGCGVAGFLKSARPVNRALGAIKTATEYRFDANPYAHVTRSEVTIGGCVKDNLESLKNLAFTLHRQTWESASDVCDWASSEIEKCRNEITVERLRADALREQLEQAMRELAEHKFAVHTLRLELEAERNTVAKLERVIDKLSQEN